MENTETVVSQQPHEHLESGVQKAPTFSPFPPNPNLDSSISDQDLPPTQQQQQQQIILEEEFQRLDVEEESEEQNEKIDEERSVVVVVEENGKEDGWSDELHAVEDAKKIEIVNDGWNDGWNDYNDDDAKKRESGNDGWNDGWNDYNDDDDAKKRESGNDGWSGHYRVDDGWKMGENENIGEESSTFTEKEKEKERSRMRPSAGDCSFYLRTGSCKFGTNCKFNHPVKKKNQAMGVKEKVKARDEYPENPGQIECKYHLGSGGCKFGKACRYNHSRGKTTIVPVLDLNFVGLPIRPGEKECPYYMRTGSCKYAANCRFNHPNPTLGSDPPSGYVNGASHSVQGVPQPTAASWSSSSESAPYAPMMFPPTQGISSQSTEWNGYQAPAYQPERHMHASTAYVMNHSTTETNVYTHHQQQMLIEEFPERPGQLECSHFLKTGDCKYRSSCKFHHPKNRMLKSAPGAVTNKGLPLRPDQNICSHYSRYGICKFGPNCKFDHPINGGTSVSSAASGQAIGGSANGSESVR